MSNATGDAGSLSDSCYPFHDSGRFRDIDFAPLPSTNPRIQSNIGDSECVSGYPRVRV